VFVFGGERRAREVCGGGRSHSSGGRESSASLGQQSEL
jgi:hypothetical protein